MLHGRHGKHNNITHDILYHHILPYISSVLYCGVVTPVPKRAAEVLRCHGGVRSDVGAVGMEMADQYDGRVYKCGEQQDLRGSMDMDTSLVKSKVGACVGRAAGVLTKFVMDVDDRFRCRTVDR